MAAKKGALEMARATIQRPPTPDERAALSALRALVTASKALDDREIHDFVRAAGVAIEFAVIDRSLDSADHAFNRRFLTRAKDWTHTTNGGVPIGRERDAKRHLVDFLFKAATIAMVAKNGPGWGLDLDDRDRLNQATEAERAMYAWTHADHRSIASMAYFPLSVSTSVLGVPGKAEDDFAKCVEDEFAKVPQNPRDPKPYVSAILRAWGMSPQDARNAARRPRRSNQK